MDALDLIFRRLVLAARAAGALERPLEVGELLETFVPYRAARRDGQLETNDDYLHVVMRLIAGERALLFADDLMQDDLKTELASPNPDLTVLRTYANTKLRLSTEGIQRVLGGNTEIDLRPPTPMVAAAAVRPPASPPVSPDAAPTPRASSGLVSTGENSTKDGSGQQTCPYCAQTLPVGRAVKFCPSCGLNLLIRRCAGCSAEIESGWQFCVTCGRKST